MTVLVRLVLFILVFDQVLLVPSLQVNLLCVDQLRDQGIVINDVPLQRLRADDRNAASHCILEGTSGFWIPLDFHRPISSFRCCKPTRKKLWINLILSMLI